MRKGILADLGFAGGFMAMAVWVIGTQFLTMPPGSTARATMIAVMSAPSGPPTTYLETAHGSTVHDIWSINAPAFLQLANADSSGSGDILVWTDPDDVEVPDATGTWTAADELFLDSEMTTFVTETDPVYVGTITRSASLIAGEMTAPNQATVPLVGMLVMTTVEYLNYEIDPITTEAVYIISRHDTVEAAEEFVEEIRETEDFDPEEPTAECYNPNWIGKDGQQCCGFELALKREISRCRNEYYRDMFLVCLVTIGGGSMATCMGLCIAALAPPTHAQIVTCLTICGIIGLSTFVLCVAAKIFELAACLDGAWAQYYRDLANAGCSIEPPDV